MTDDQQSDAAWDPRPPEVARPAAITALWLIARQALQSAARAQPPEPSADTASMREFVSADRALDALVRAFEERFYDLANHLSDARAQWEQHDLKASGYRYERDRARQTVRALWAQLSDAQRVAAAAELGTDVAEPWVAEHSGGTRDERGQRRVDADLSRITAGGRGTVRAPGLHPGEQVVLIEEDAEPVPALVVEVRADKAGETATVRALRPSADQVEDWSGARWGAVELPMLCTCGEQGKAEASALMDEVCRRLSATIQSVVDRAVRSLAFAHGYRSLAIHTDQWSVVDASHWDGRRMIVQCDEPTHGVLAIWRHVADAEQSQQ